MSQDNQMQGEMSLTRKVIRMGMLIHRYYEAKAHRHGATGDPLRGQGRVLALLKAKPETTQRELSYLLDMRQQSLSELLSKLEEKGIDPHAMRRGPHHGPQGPGPRCGGPEGPHMMQRGPYGAPDGFGGPGRCGRGGHHGMHQA